MSTKASVGVVNSDLSDAAEAEGLHFDGMRVWDGDLPLFETGLPQNAHTLRMMIYAWRQGRTWGEKWGRGKLQGEIKTLLGIRSPEAEVE